MKFLRALSAVVLGLGALSLGAGCAAESDELDMAGELEIAEPDSEPLGWIPGSGGSNKFLTLDFQNQKVTGYHSTRYALGTYAFNYWWVAGNTYNNTLLGSSAGRDFIKYSARCALPTTVTLHAQLGATHYLFPGQALLTTTPSWLGAPLSTAQAQDLFSCLLAHLNKFGIEVPINVSGPSIKNTAGADSGFDWDEGVWMASIDATNPQEPAFEFNVWPLDDLMQCGSYVAQLEDRVCAGYAGDCGVVVRGDRDSACRETETGWYCTDLSGHELPAIQTRLQTKDVELMYDNCPM